MAVSVHGWPRRLAWLVFALLVPTIAAADSPSIAVIVHPQRSEAVSAGELAQSYLRRRRFWDDATLIVPLNLPADSPIRRRFVRRVLRQSENQLADYWNRRYFEGQMPPATLASTSAVLRYVAGDRNAVGYVLASEVDASVRVVLRID